MHLYLRTIRPETPSKLQRAPNGQFIPGGRPLLIAYREGVQKGAETFHQAKAGARGV